MNSIPLISVLVFCGLLLIWAPLIIFACCRAAGMADEKAAVNHEREVLRLRLLKGIFV
jgi:hypothetical protein